MSNFVYKIEKNERDSHMELKIYKINEKKEVLVESIESPYVILAKKDEFESLNIESDKILLAKEKFLDKNEENVVKIEIESKELRDYVLSQLKEHSFTTYEGDLPPEHRYLVDNNIELISNNVSYLPPKYLSFDIETIGVTNEQEIVLISTYSPDDAKVSKVYCNLEKIKNKHLEKVKSTKYEGFELIQCVNEKELLEIFKKDVIDFKPQIIIGWNVIDFDFKIVKERMDSYGIEFKFSDFEGECKLRIYSDFFMNSTLTCPGVLVFDVIHLLKMNYISFEDYKLNTVAKEVLGDEKIDLEDEGTANEDMEGKINAITNMLENNPVKLIDYNFKDSVLTSQILEKLNLMELMCKRSIMTGTPLSRVRSPIATLDIMYLKELHKRGYVASSNFNFSDSNSIEGAFVLEPKQGFYEDIFVFDFKSLYPSVMMTFNIDPFTYNENGIIESPTGAKFTKEPGILPGLLLKLYKERDIAKSEKDEIKSYAIKINMNSFYGAIASPKSRFYNHEIGESITGFARFIIKKAMKYVEDKGHSAAIYGDSVIGDTKIWIRKKGSYKIKEIEIENLFNLEGKEKEEIQIDSTIKYYKMFENLETLTMNDSFENIWKPLNYVMKHKSSKKLYKLHFNNQQNVTVTEDHSLISYDFYKGLFQIKPENTSKGIYNYGFKINKKSKESHFAQFLGFFVGDGYLENNGFNIGISTGLDLKEFTGKVLNKLPELKKSKIYHKGKGDINFSNVELYSKMEFIGFKREWTSKTKRIPKGIFDQSNNFICDFVKGLYSSDGTIIQRGNTVIIRYTSINKKLILDIKQLLMQIGVGSTYFKENSTNKYKGKDNGTYSYHLVINNQKHKFFMENIGFIFDRKNEKFQTGKIKKKITSKHIIKKEIIENKENYVYDISVEDTHRFYGNDILLKNTDSVFVKFDEKFKNFDDKVKFGKQLEAEINTFFENWVQEEYKQKNFLKIEFEKLYSKFFIASKKRYVGHDEFTKKTSFTGMEAVRGDWTQLARQFQVELVDLIFNGGKKEEIEKFILEKVKRLKNGEYDELLVYTKKITKPLEQYVKMTPPHVKAAREISNFSGRVVKYVLTKDGPKHISLIDDKLVYDYDHYIDKQLKGVSDDLLESFGIDFDKVVYSSKHKGLDNFF